MFLLQFKSTYLKDWMEEANCEGLDCRLGLVASVGGGKESTTEPTLIIE